MVGSNDISTVAWLKNAVNCIEKGLLMNEIIMLRWIRKDESIKMKEEIFQFNNPTDDCPQKQI